MEKRKTAVFLGIFLLVQSCLGVIGQEVRASEKENGISEEDLEIIKNLDFLDNLDLFEKDIVFLEDYEDIDQSESIGESDE